MLKKVLFLLGLTFFFSCQVRKPEIFPSGSPYFRSLSVKFRFQDGEVRQNGRVLWRFDESSSKFFFFTPLNQVNLELDIAGEDAVLVNFSKKSFWKGDFSQMLDRLWGIGMTLAELKALLVHGDSDQPGFMGKGIEARVERDQESGEMRLARLRRGAAELELRIQKNEMRPGSIVLVDYVERYRLDELERVLEND
jgi:hypothetical protein